MFSLARLAFGGMLGEEVGTFRSCSISLNGKPQNSFRNDHFPNLPGFKKIWFPEFFSISDLFERLREKAFPMLGKRGQTMSRLLIKALSHTGLLAAPPVAWNLPQN